MKQCSINLNDKRWQVIEKNINSQKRKHNKSPKDIINAIQVFSNQACYLLRLCHRQSGNGTDHE